VRDIDKEARKGVVPPGPADLAGLLIDREIDPGTLQRFGHEEPRHSRTGNDNPEFSTSHYTSPDLPDLRQPKFKPAAAVSTTQVSIADQGSSVL
jgi:hypothetical protein